MNNALTTRHRLLFWTTCAAAPVIGFVWATISRSGDTPLFIVAVIFAFYMAFFALLFFPTYIEATRNCDLPDRAVLFTVSSMVFAHVVAIGGAAWTESNLFILAYPIVGTASLLILRKTPLCEDRPVIDSASR